MADLHERFEGVDRVPAPDRWGEIEHRATDRPAGGSPRPSRRAGTVVTALAIGGFSVALVIYTFTGTKSPVPVAGLRPNGPLIYVARAPGSATGIQNQDLFAVDPASGDVMNLTNTDDIVETDPVWSPDGSQVVFVRQSLAGDTSTATGVSLQTGLYVMNSDGSALREIRPCAGGWTCDVSSIAWSPGGTRLAWVGPGPASNFPELDVYDLGTGTTTPICSRDCAQGLADVTWSPDGTRLAFSNAGVISFRSVGLLPSAIWVADADGGGVDRIAGYDGHACYVERPASCPFDGGPAWSPDGTSIAFGSYTETDNQGGARQTLMVVDASGGTSKTLATCDRQYYCVQWAHPAWSPDGTSVATVLDYNRPIVTVADPSSGTVHDVSSCGDGGCVDPSQVWWSPDGHAIAFEGGAGRTTNLYTMSDRGGDVRELASDIQGFGGWLPAGAIVLGSPGPSPTPTPTPDVGPVPSGTIVFSSANGSMNEDNGTEIWSMSSDGSGLTQLTNNDSLDVYPAISPDGSQVVFSSDRVGDPNTLVYVMNADGSDQHALTQDRGGGTRPAWSPDGSRIAYLASGGVMVMDADGSNPHVLVPGQVEGFAWSPDGRAMVIAINGDQGNVHLSIVELATGERRAVTSLPGAQMDPTWSPDGTTIAFSWVGPTGDGIYLVAPDGSGLRRLTDAGTGQASWSPDGAWLTFVETTDLGGAQVALIRADGAGLTVLTKMKPFVGESLVFSQTSDPSWS